MSGPRYQPSREEFLALARDHAVVPVWREVLADLQTPLAVFDQLRGADGRGDAADGSRGRGSGARASAVPPVFLLESVERGERWGRHSFIGLRPLLELRARHGKVELRGAAPQRARETAAAGDPLATLACLVDELRTPQLEGLPPLFVGAVGYLAWDVVRFIERLPATGVDDLGWDDARLMVPGSLVAFDHLRQRLLVVTNVLVGDDPARQYEEAMTESEALVARLGERASAPPVEPPRAAEVTDAKANMPRERYLESVERAKEYIRAGDVFQVVPSHRFAVETSVDPFTVYRVLRVINPSPYLYIFDWGDLQVVGSSPEALVTVQGSDAMIQPIAGSRPRAAAAAADAQLERSLLADDKERAEHVMLVDLARNDLGRICDMGSVRVDGFMRVVRYSHIMHLVSTVHGRLRSGTTPVDVVKATFPAGTLSGAPKVRAMEIIDELEPTRRGLYGGGIGYLDFAGNLDLCIAIRTLVLRDGWAYVQAGAGIVADSVAEREYAETQDKSMALLAAVRAAEDMDAGR